MFTPDEKIKLAGLLLFVTVKGVGVYEGDDKEDKYRDLASFVDAEMELAFDMPLIGIETLSVSEDVELSFPDVKGDKLENLLNREPKLSSIFPQ